MRVSDRPVPRENAWHPTNCPVIARGWTYSSLTPGEPACLDRQPVGRRRWIQHAAGHPLVSAFPMADLHGIRARSA